ncbi:BolA protein [Pseudomonas sp. NFACC19-2]|uniref:BolA family transcriptional regulator n=1 Tax=Ectopseudomonas toyotomiensis TaxID=554344 RepID=A0A1I5QW12_9GAMM|nr:MULTISPECIES: BolA family protein [Pseudomonas]AQZ34239.1 BolA family transcriptional regulator [Pseudomonas sp. LPH1]MBG0838947.1 BolA family transcriptional regulator [Pseudomonas toyotomiensis]MDH0699977.1 BolA family transcriptional regulator [Pseudomonas toyotomiensis]PIA74577.1 BolA family transcriptional regulator [Pseudomonas toyotomiensis]QSL91895.1 BolA family transcriptional regulator [Pseudomonas toyotomiensis]
MSKQDLIVTALAALQPEYLDVLDESHMHSRGLETHYKAVIVSSAFAGLNSVKRHQKVYATVGELMGQIHALALHTYTPEEWAAQGVAPASPTCRGGH